MGSSSNYSRAEQIQELCRVAWEALDVTDDPAPYIALLILACSVGRRESGLVRYIGVCPCGTPDNYNIAMSGNPESRCGLCGQTFKLNLIV